MNGLSDTAPCRQKTRMCTACNPDFAKSCVAQRQVRTTDRDSPPCNAQLLYPHRVICCVSSAAMDNNRTL
jgi:hypothetical protein